MTTKTTRVQDGLVALANSAKVPVEGLAYLLAVARKGMFRQGDYQTMTADRRLTPAGRVRIDRAWVYARQQGGRLVVQESS